MEILNSQIKNLELIIQGKITGTDAVNNLTSANMENKDIRDHSIKLGQLISKAERIIIYGNKSETIKDKAFTYSQD